MVRNNLAKLFAGDGAPKRQDVADNLGISRQYLSLIISEKKVPTAALMFQLAECFHLAIGDVWWHEKDHKGVPAQSTET